MINLKDVLSFGRSSAMSFTEFIEVEISNWIKSKERQDAIKGEEYLKYKHDILNKKRMVIGEGGELVEVDNLPNNRIIDNQYAKMLVQKRNYLFGKPFTLYTENERYKQSVQQVLNKRFNRRLKNLASKSLSGGIAWLYVYYDNAGELTFKIFPAYESLAFWKDSEHTELDCFVRVYEQEEYEGRELKTVQKVEVYTLEGIQYYVLNKGKLIADVEKEDTTYLKIEDERYNWGKIPIIPFKYNDNETPLLNKVKSLQDGINDIISTFKNNMEEDSRNTIIVLVNYDGQNLGEFRRNLSQYGAVKVRSDAQGQTGDVKTLSVEVNAENYKAILEVFKKAIIENAMGYDAKDDRLAGNANQMNIQSMYNDIDMDANDMEMEFQAGLEELMWFIDAHLHNTGQGDYSNEDITFIFNRDMITNQSEIIDNCRNSVGIISDETIISRHPFVVDPKKEMDRLKAQNQEQADENNIYKDAFNGGADEEE